MRYESSYSGLRLDQDGRSTAYESPCSDLLVSLEEHLNSLISHDASKVSNLFRHKSTVRWM
jgi:hypothetical protein